MTLRRLKLLAVVLVFSNLLLGAFSIYLLRRTDSDYTALIGRSVPVLVQIRDAGKEAGSVYRALIEGLVTSDPVKCSAALGRVRTALDLGKQYRIQALKADLLQSDPGVLREFAEAGDAYEKAVTQMLPRVTPENTADAERDHIEQLQGVYDRYGSAIEKVTALVVSHTQAISDRYTAQMHSRSAVVLGIAGWPVLLAAIIVVLTVAVVIVMLFVFRQADAGNGP